MSQWENRAFPDKYLLLLRFLSRTDALNHSLEHCRVITKPPVYISAGCIMVPYWLYISAGCTMCPTGYK